jgi:hypothetical protein
MKNLSVILLVFLFISCTNNKNEELYGNWCFEKELPSTKFKDSPNRFTSDLNFEIQNDSIIAFKFNFFHRVHFNNENSNFGTLYNLGNKTKYKFVNSKIIFENLNDNMSDTIILTKIDKKELVIEIDKRKYLLKNKPKIKYDTNFYDAIVVNQGMCFGTCPQNSTYINRNGNFIFNGAFYNTENNYFHSKLKKEQVSEVFNLFQNINVMSLNNNYFRMVTCSSSSSITFIKNNKIVKSINDYANAAPIDLVFAMNKTSYIYQKAKINHYYEPYIQNMLEIGVFENKKCKYRLIDSELTFLQNCINSGKKVKNNFIKKYELTFLEDQDNYNKTFIKKIFTDGRFYQINYKDNTSITVDIGNDFIENNPIIKQKRIE